MGSEMCIRDRYHEASVGDIVLGITVRANLRVFRKSSYQKTGLPDTPGRGQKNLNKKVNVIDTIG